MNIRVSCLSLALLLSAHAYSASDYELVGADKWPLSIKEGRAGCAGPRAPFHEYYFQSGNKKYALNGWATGKVKQGKYLPLHPIWLPRDPLWVTIEGKRVDVFENIKKDLGPLFDLAESRC